MELGSGSSSQLPQLLSGPACMKWRSLRAPLLDNDMSLMAMQCMRTTSSTQNLNHSPSQHLHESCAFLLSKPHLPMSHSEGMQSAKSCCRQTLLHAPSFVRSLGCRKWWAMTGARCRLWWLLTQS